MCRRRNAFLAECAIDLEAEIGFLRWQDPIPFDQIMKAKCGAQRQWMVAAHNDDGVIRNQDFLHEIDRFMSLGKAAYHHVQLTRPQCWHQDIIRSRHDLDHDAAIVAPDFGDGSGKQIGRR
ncbi:hypothetical protein D3C80_1501850 [compost metagenome]